MAKPTKPDPLQHLTIAETARLMGVCEKTVRREIEDERLIATGIRASIRVPYAEIVRYVAATKTKKRKKTSKQEKT